MTAYRSTLGHGSWSGWIELDLGCLCGFPCKFVSSCKPLSGTSVQLSCLRTSGTSKRYSKEIPLGFFRVQAHTNWRAPKKDWQEALRSYSACWLIRKNPINSVSSGKQTLLQTTQLREVGWVLPQPVHMGPLKSSGLRILVKTLPSALARFISKLLQTFHLQILTLLKSNLARRDRFNLRKFLFSQSGLDIHINLFFFFPFSTFFKE